MAKIKSTLDLVMERTKNLNVTDADREKLHTKEGTDMVRSWLQRYLSGKIDADELRMNLDEQKEAPGPIKNILRKELADSIRIDGDNKRVVEAFTRVFDVNAESIEKLMASYKARLEPEKARCLDQLGQDLRLQGISGTSVVPNISNCRQWQDFVLNTQEDLRRHIMTATDMRTSDH